LISILQVFLQSLILRADDFNARVSYLLGHFVLAVWFGFKCADV